MDIIIKQFSKRFFLILIPSSITLLTLNFYGIAKASLFYSLIAVSMIFYLKIGFKNSTIFSVSFLISTLILNFIMGVFLEDKMYYRLHEKLSVYNPELGRKLYKKIRN